MTIFYSQASNSNRNSILGPDYNNRSVLSWHYYCELFDSKAGNDTTQTILIQIFCDAIFGPTVFNTVKSRTEEIGGGSMLTEFGLCYPNISNPMDKNTIECNRVLDLADLHFQSWTYWVAWRLLLNFTLIALFLYTYYVL